MTRRILGLAVIVVALGACEDFLGPQGFGDVTIGVATVDPGTTADIATGDIAASEHGSLTVTGSNGTLTIDDIYVIVGEFELEGAEDACEETEGTSEEEELEDCEEFESPPSLVALPLDGSELAVATANVPVGTYSELEWEVEDINLDEDDEDATELEAVQTEIDAIFGAGEWPAEASMAVIGSFQHTDSTEATPFTTFFEAEIEVETAITPPLEITEDGPSRDLTINFDPAAWFLLDSGEAMNLAALSGSVVEFELEFEDGVASIDHDDEDEDT